MALMLIMAFNMVCMRVMKAKLVLILVMSGNTGLNAGLILLIWSVCLL